MTVPPLKESVREYEGPLNPLAMTLKERPVPTVMFVLGERDWTETETLFAYARVIGRNNETRPKKRVRKCLFMGLYSLVCKIRSIADYKYVWEEKEGASNTS